jgi:hypothetical protein
MVDHMRIYLISRIKRGNNLQYIFDANNMVTDLAPAALSATPSKLPPTLLLIGCGV